eukprot:72671-Rhodomonas_salina.5
MCIRDRRERGRERGRQDGEGDGRRDTGTQAHRDGGTEGRRGAPCRPYPTDVPTLSPRRDALTLVSQAEAEEAQRRAEKERAEAVEARSKYEERQVPAYARPTRSPVLVFSTEGGRGASSVLTWGTEEAFLSCAVLTIRGVVGSVPHQRVHRSVQDRQPSRPAHHPTHPCTLSILPT